MTKYLRCKTNGFIFEHNDRLAALPEWEAVTEQEAFPERFAPVELAKRSVQVDLTIPEEVVTLPTEVSPELKTEASRAFGGPKAARTRRGNTDAPAPSFTVAGLQGEF